MLDVHFGMKPFLVGCSYQQAVICLGNFNHAITFTCQSYL